MVLGQCQGSGGRGKWLSSRYILPLERYSPGIAPGPVHHFLSSSQPPYEVQKRKLRFRKVQQPVSERFNPGLSKPEAQALHISPQYLPGQDSNKKNTQAQS